MTPPRALILGITGQDGSYLAELLLDKGYEVHGVVRRGSTFSTERIAHLLGQLTLHHGDLLDPHTLHTAFAAARPHEVYHLAAPSHVAESFHAPAYALDVITRGTLYVLEACRAAASARTPEPRLYIASTSEMFGDAPAPQNEETVFRPRSPYAVAKLAAHQLAGVYREAYGLWVARGILFNHESPRRLPTFVTRKITRGLVRVACGLESELVLGNLNARRDWGHAKDYVRAMWLMLQQGQPDDYVIATGQTRSVADFLSQAAGEIGVYPPGPGRGTLYWPDVVRADARYTRPLEVEHLCGDASKARERLGWRPEIGFEALVREMVTHDAKLATREVER